MKYYIATLYYLYNKIKLSILDIDKKERISRHTLTSRTTILLFYHLLKSIKGKLTSTHFNKSTDNCPDHISKETIGRNGKTPHTWFNFIPVSFGNRAEICLCISIYLGETREVSITHKNMSRFIHLSKIQHPIYLPTVGS